MRVSALKESFGVFLCAQEVTTDAPGSQKGWVEAGGGTGGRGIVLEMMFSFVLS